MSLQLVTGINGVSAFKTSLNDLRLTFVQGASNEVGAPGAVVLPCGVALLRAAIKALPLAITLLHRFHLTHDSC